MKIRLILSYVLIIAALAACGRGSSSSTDPRVYNPAPTTATGAPAQPASHATVPPANVAGSHGVTLISPGGGPNAVCDLIKPEELPKFIGSLNKALNDRYLGPGINSCVWVGSAGRVELVVSNTGTAGADYRTNVSEATSENNPMCAGGTAGASNHNILCVWGNTMYRVWGTLNDGNSFKPLNDDTELIALMTLAVGRA
jgi:hypothetical protein